MRISTIASGSSGNCIYVGTDNTHLLVDTGVSKKRTEEGLFKNDIDMKDINGILITHEHIDHINGLGVISRKYNIPIYCTPKTKDAILSTKKLGEIDKELFNNIYPDDEFAIGDIDICAFDISHDAAWPVGYRLTSDNKSVAVATDMGKFDDYIISHLKNLDGIVVEANHDVRMVLAGIYPYYLKQRILGDDGHLSNENSGKLINEILHDNIKHIILAHLSKENNYEELAFQTVKSEIELSDNKYKADDFNILVAKRDIASEIYYI